MSTQFTKLQSDCKSMEYYKKKDCINKNYHYMMADLKEIIKIYYTGSQQRSGIRLVLSMTSRAKAVIESKNTFLVNPNFSTYIYFLPSKLLQKMARFHVHKILFR